MEYRIVELTVEEKTILTKKFDFGCSCIVQDHLKVFEASDDKDSGRFALKLVRAVLYRMLEDKVLNFNIVNSLDPQTTAYLFLKFQTWYREDTEELQSTLSDIKTDGIIMDDDDEVGDNSLYYLAYSIFKSFGTSLEQVYSWKFDDMINILYFSKADKVREHLKKQPVIAANSKGGLGNVGGSE